MDTPAADLANKPPVLIADLPSTSQSVDVIGVVTVLTVALYEACPACSKKQAPGNGPFTCTNCRALQERTACRILVNGQMSDSTGSFKFTMFHASTVKTLGIAAESTKGLSLHHSSFSLLSFARTPI